MLSEELTAIALVHDRAGGGGAVVVKVSDDAFVGGVTSSRHDGARAVLLAVEVGVHETVGVRGAGHDGGSGGSPLMRL